MTETIIFDLGGVLVDWNPRYLYRKIFQKEEEMEYFLSEVCNSSWNLEQDGGRSFVEANKVLIGQFPEFEYEITAFQRRWTEMLGGAMNDTVAILRNLHAGKKNRLFALTNWSAETFPYALERFDFLNLFEGILVSGMEKMKKPDTEIFELMLKKYQIDRAKTIFIDDNEDNVIAAQNLGIESWLFTSAEDLDLRFKNKGIL